MNYESWRISYQDSEQAARALFKQVDELSKIIADHEVTIRICQFNEKNQTARAIQAELALAELTKSITEAA